MNFRPSHGWRRFIAVFIILLVVCEALVYVATAPRPTEQFMELYVLGPNQLVAGYYPNNRPNLHIGEQLVWYLGVTNNMGSVQFISIVVKLSNQTIQPPNDTLALESPAPSVMEFDRFVQDNGTWLTPFTWSISNATSGGGVTHILVLHINNETFQVPNWSATHGYNFRFIFELWTWQTAGNEFEFGWTANGKSQAAWLQIWFNMTTPYTSSR